MTYIPIRHPSGQSCGCAKRLSCRFVTVNAILIKREQSKVKAFLTHLAVEGKVSASTQNQALSSLLFLYK
ncbi:phage integrase N-terminal SAM-like domain-containing protein [Methylobacter sp. BlB1]|uniref:phage integrase N-terminal SAM-like domain-containing protein n=1 Tax=Methylobacter sp. BlB1 TaxID=2785914 RepID=UPI001E28335F|nr:phage integrase N-terminal SAM-like domain-containing protein [Methylobacter sp. BlB1]